jgi:hypothetical protein
VRGLAGIAALVVAVVVAHGMSRAEEKKVDQFEAEISVNSGESPWQDYTASAEEEQRSMEVRAVKIATEFEPIARLQKYASDPEPLIAIDRMNRRVVVNERHFGDLRRAKVTSLRAGERAKLGIVKSAALVNKPRSLVRFLVESQLIMCYVHVGAQLRISDDKEAAGRYLAVLVGSHEYYTNKRNVGHLHFAVELDKSTGTVEVVGL